MLLFFIWITAYAVGFTSFSADLNALPRWLQLIVYIIAGVAWIFPLRPLFRWMNSSPSDTR